MKKRKILALLLSGSMILSNFTGFSSLAAEGNDGGDVHKVTGAADSVEREVFAPILVELYAGTMKKNAKANSEQSPAEGNDGPAAYAFDDQERWWHSRYAGDAAEGEVESGLVSESNPVWIQTGFDAVKYVRKITYLPRQDQAFGRINEYEVQIANLEDPKAEPSESDFETVKSGNLTNQKAESTIMLDFPEEATHMRLVAKSVYAGGGTAHVAAQRITVFAAPVSEIEVTAPTKKEYKINESLDLEGMQVIAHYSDNTTRDVTEDAEVTGFDSSTAGEKTVTVSYGEETGSFVVTVKADEKPPVVQISDDILKENATVNSEQVPSSGNGGPATWAFDDEAHWWHSRWSGDAPEGEVESGEVSENNPIWIQMGFDKVEYIKELTYLPRQDSQPYGRINEYEIQIANLEDPSAEPTDADFETVKSGSLPNQKPESKITLDSPVAATHMRLVAKSVYTNSLPGVEGDPQAGYSGTPHVAAQRIKVYATEPVSLEVTAGKTDYLVGDELDKEQMTATLTFSDGSTVDVMGDVDITGFDASAPAEEQEVTVTYHAFTYGDFTDTFTVTVKAEEKPAVTQISDDILKENAKANSEQKPEEGSDGPAAWAFDDEARWWHSRWSGDAPEGEVESGEVSENNPIWIQMGFDKVEYIKELTYLPRQDSQPYGRINEYEIQIANLEDPSAEPTDADFETVKSGSLPNQKPESKITLDSPVAATHMRLVAKSVYTNSLPNVPEDPQAGYNGSPHVAAQRIKVYATEPVSFEVTAGKTDYFVGDELDKEQMTATLTFSDGSTVDVMEDVEITGFDASAPAEEQEVTVTYGDFTDTFTVTIKAKEEPEPTVTLENITVTAPTKTKYKIGETFDSTGMVVTATYSDQTTKNVTEDAQVTGFDSSTAGEKTITVTYQEKTATFVVIVEEEAPESLKEALKQAKEAAAKAELAKEAADKAVADAQAQVTEAEAKVTAAQQEAEKAKAEAEKAKLEAEAAIAAQERAEEAAREVASIKEDREAAEKAKEAAEDAKIAAIDAQTKAEDAQEAAEDAKKAAATAQEEAVNAKEAAEAAQTEAAKAKRAAEEAAKAAGQSEEDALQAKEDALAAQAEAEEAQKAAKAEAAAAKKANEAAGTAKTAAEAAAGKAEIAQKLAEAQAQVAVKALDESKAYAEKAISAQKTAEEAAKRAEAARKEAEEELKRVQEEAEKKLEEMQKILEETVKSTLQKYSDFKAGSWYEDYIVDVYLRGYMTGMNSDYFGINETLVRAQFAVILYRMAGEPEVEFKDTFADVEEGQFYSDAVIWASEEGIITGYEDSGLFGANDMITREQMATILYRYAKTLEGKELSKDGKLDDFPDAEKVQDFAKEALAWSVEEGIVTGKTVGEEKILDPQGSALRAECAAVIARFSNWVEAE